MTVNLSLDLCAPPVRPLHFVRHPRSIDDGLLFLMGEAANAEAGERGFDEPGFEQNAGGVAVAIAFAGHAKG